MTVDEGSDECDAIVLFQVGCYSHLKTFRHIPRRIFERHSRKGHQEKGRQEGQKA